jgi:hypothetical protein
MIPLLGAGALLYSGYRLLSSDDDDYDSHEDIERQKKRAIEESIQNKKEAILNDIESFKGHSISTIKKKYNRNIAFIDKSVMCDKVDIEKSKLNHDIDKLAQSINEIEQAIEILNNNKSVDIDDTFDDNDEISDTFFWMIVSSVIVVTIYLLYNYTELAIYGAIAIGSYFSIKNSKNIIYKLFFILVTAISSLHLTRLIVQ